MIECVFSFLFLLRINDNEVRNMKVEGIGSILFVKNFHKMAGFYEGMMNLSPDASESG